MQARRFSLTITIKKSGGMVYFSQLDINRLLERALRRSGLPLYFSEGFSPRPKVSFALALKLGVAGEIPVTLYFSEPVSLPELKERLVKEFPLGLDIL